MRAQTIKIAKVAKVVEAKQAKAKPAKVAAALLLENQLCFALYSASLTMTKVYKPWLTQNGLTYPQYVTLLALWKRDGQTVGELGEKLFLDSGTLTPLLKRMQTAGLVNRERSADDERVVRILLTDKGRALYDTAAAIHTAVACSTGCNPGERRSLTQQLQQLRSALAEAGQ